MVLVPLDSFSEIFSSVVLAINALILLINGTMLIVRPGAFFDGISRNPTYEHLSMLEQKLWAIPSISLGAVMLGLGIIMGLAIPFFWPVSKAILMALSTFMNIGASIPYMMILASRPLYDIEWKKCSVTGFLCGGIFMAVMHAAGSLFLLCE